MKSSGLTIRSLAVLALCLAACQPTTLTSKDTDPVIGDWWWRVSDKSEGDFYGPKVIAYNGYLVDVKTEDDNDARRPDARVAGFWKLLNREKRQYLLTWQDPWNTHKDNLVLSEDGNFLKGTNDNGRVIEGVRVSP
jgi:hypothetical protein